MNKEITEEARRRGITRLCHFAPSRNLVHIMGGATGVLATKHLTADERQVFTPTDLKRLDGHEQHVCCSVEYPNGWYFDKARGGDILFQDWVVLFVRSDCLGLPGTLFCARNAAARHGMDLREGIKAFSAMFADCVLGAYGKKYVRGASRLLCSPTDDQAEVLVLDRIEIDDLLGIAVLSETQAKNEIVRLRLAGVVNPDIPWYIAPDLFDKRRLSVMIQKGIRPTECLWHSSLTS